VRPNRIVVIGTSAGGIETLRTVIAEHAHSAHNGKVERLLARSQEARLSRIRNLAIARPTRDTGNLSDSRFSVERPQP
jgi:hypothetical protein